MGKTISSLNKWWKEIEKRQLLVYGPQIAFKLNFNGKTVLLFGENHNDTRTCGKNQQTFVKLFNFLIKRAECEETDIITEQEDIDEEIRKKQYIVTQTKNVETQ